MIDIDNLHIGDFVRVSVGDWTGRIGIVAGIASEATLRGSQPLVLIVTSRHHTPESVSALVGVALTETLDVASTVMALCHATAWSPESLAPCPAVTCRCGHEAKLNRWRLPKQVCPECREYIETGNWW